MNWEFVLSTLFGMIIFTVIVLTVLFYIQHNLSKRQRTRQKALHPTEGRYFKRFVPYKLKKKYTELEEQFQSSAAVTRKISSYMWYAGVIGVALVLVAGYLYKQRDRFARRIELTAQEVQDLKLDHHYWSKSSDRRIPTFGQIEKDLRRRRFALVFSEKDREWRVGSGGRALMEEAHKVWSEWLDALEMNHVDCDMDNLGACPVGRGEGILVVLPGHWKSKTLDAALARGYSMILFGPPAQIFELGGEPVFSWAGMTFEQYTHSEPQHILLRADHRLTLGFDAGFRIPAVPLYEGYRVRSEDPEAVAVQGTRISTGTTETRLQVITKGQGRLIWMDYLPGTHELNKAVNPEHLAALNGAVFRYLLRKSYSAVATWPQGKEFGALIGQITGEEYGLSEKVTELLEEKKMPITWFLMSDRAHRHQKLTRKMAELGEVSCVADSGLVLPNGDAREQVKRVATCLKAVEQISGRRPAGLLPPEENFNGETVDAVVNNQLSYYFSGFNADRAVPALLVSPKTNVDLVEVPRTSSNASDIWEKMKLNITDSKSLVSGEVDWLKRLGGLYVFAYQSRHLSDHGQLELLSHVLGVLEKESVFLTTAKNLSEWWRARERVIAGKSLSETEYKQYQPMRLTVESSGQLTRKEIHP